MQPAKASFGPVHEAKYPCITNYTWVSRTPSNITAIIACKIDNARHITLNFHPEPSVATFCVKNGFNLSSAILQTGSATFSTPEECLKVCNILFSSCIFQQESDKLLLQQIAEECPKKIPLPIPSNWPQSPNRPASSILDIWHPKD